MANWSDIAFFATQEDYIADLEQLRIRSQNVATEVENARDGEASVLARIQKCMVMSVGFTQDLDANGFRITNLPEPLSASEPATKGYADALSFAAALPAQAGNAGMGVVTDGAAARWGISNAEAMAILNFINY
jgi:hypothetical protein